jgi:hypothetical protein
MIINGDLSDCEYFTLPLSAPIKQGSLFIVEVDLGTSEFPYWQGQMMFALGYNQQQAWLKPRNRKCQADGMISKGNGMLFFTAPVDIMALNLKTFAANFKNFKVVVITPESR